MPRVLTANTPVLINFYLNLIKKSEIIAVDIETAGVEEYEDGLDWRKGYIVSIGFYGRIGSKEVAFHIPLNHERFQCIDKPFFVDALRRFFSDEKLKIAMHNGNFDRHFIERMGIPVRNFWMDTAVAYHITNSGEERVGLKEVAIKKYNAPMEKFKKFFNKKHPINTSDPKLFATYLYNDVAYTHQLAVDCVEELNETKLTRYFFEIEMPCLRTIFKMEERGIHINETRLKAYGLKLEGQISKSKQILYKMAGDPNFNPNSTKQMRHVVFDVLHAPKVKVSKKTQEPSCDVEALEFYAAMTNNKKLAEFASAVLEYRDKQKIFSTYVEGILAKMVDGKINPSYHTLTQTGRLGSRNPNAQNIPAKSEIRSCFVPPAGHVLIDLDYSQIELRVVAHLSKDPQMLKVYRDPKGDIHQSTANGCSCSRDFAKVVNFGLIYRMHFTSLAKKLKITEDEAEKYVKGYFKTYAGVARWQKSEAARAHTYGRTRTILGRPRELPEINDHNKWIREKKEREGINHPVQGTAGEICKCAMIDVENSLELKQLKCYLLMQIHDELVLKCPVANKEKAVKIIRSLMEKALTKRGIKFDVPIKAEGGFGSDWLKAKEAA